MAIEKIELQVGASFPGQKKLTEAHGSVKKMQSAARECSEVGKHALGQIASQLNGEFSPALRIGLGALEELARGGLWGVLAAAGNVAFQGIIYLWNRATEAAKEYAAVLGDRATGAVSAVADRFRGLSEEMNHANSAAKEMLSVLNGEVSAKAEMKIHQLHVETLQKLTDAASEAAKRAILADEALAAAKIKGAAAIEQAENNRRSAEQTVQSARERLAAAENALADISAQKAELEQKFGVQERSRALQEISLAETAYAKNMISHAEFMKRRDRWVQELKSVEEKYASEISAHKEVVRAEKEASAAVEAAKREEVSAVRNVTLAKQKEASAALQMERSVVDAQQKINDLAAAEDAAAKAESERIRAKAIETMTTNAAVKIQEVCNKYNLEAAAYIDLYKRSLESGLTHTEAYNQLQSQLNEDLKKRSEAEKKAAEAADETGSGGKDGKGSKGKPLYVSLSTPISDEIGKTGGKTWSETQKAAREQHRMMMQDAEPFYHAMKGHMPEDQQRLFENYMMNKYTPDQVKKIWEEAQKKQLFDNKERKKQTRYLSDMLDAMKKQGLK